MNEPLLLKTKEKPRLLNDEMVIGVLVAPFLTAGLGVTLLAMAAGGLIGGLIGKNRMEREQAQGKIVGNPSYSNKNTLIEGLFGANLGIIAGTIGATALGVAAAPLVLATTIGGGLLGLAYGANKGKKIQETEYEIARIQHIQELEKSKSPTIAFENELATGKSFAAEILARRERADNKQIQL